MTRRTTRIAALGAGALFSLGILCAAPAGASDGAQADANVSADAADLINQTLGLVNQACMEASQVGGAAAQALASEKGISVAATPAGSALNLNVLLPALTDSLPALGSLPLLGGLTGQVDAAQPVKISCSTAANGTGLGLSAAGVGALVSAIVPGVDLSTLDIDIPAVDASASTTAGAANLGTTAVSATAAGSVPAPKVSAASPAVRASAAAAPATTSTTATAAATPASASGGIVAQTVGSPGALARTGAGVGALGLLGSALFGSGRLIAFGRKLLKIG
jgi:hypothetical protein